jgi:hypothetical protein
VLCLAVVAAAPSSADAPQVLQNEQPVSGALTGNAAGAFAFYAVEYAGDESVVTIELRYAPADPVTKSGVGFNVYASDGYLIGQGMEVEDTGGEGVLRLEYADGTEATWLVQVQNYIPDHSVAYTISVSGLPEVSAPAAPEPAQEVASEPEVHATVETSVPGSLVGNAAGAFVYYTIDYPGDESVESIELWYVPADPVTTAAVGFNVYGPEGRLVGSGAQVADTGGDGLLALDYSDSEPTTLTVQLYNYLDSAILYYRLSSVLTTE